MSRSSLTLNGYLTCLGTIVDGTLIQRLSGSNELTGFEVEDDGEGVLASRFRELGVWLMMQRCMAH